MLSSNVCGFITGYDYMTQHPAERNAHSVPMMLNNPEKKKKAMLWLIQWKEDAASELWN
jgi:hypothetical protein